MYEQAYNPFAKNLSVVKEYFCKPLTLVIGCVRILAVVLGIVSGILAASQVRTLLLDLQPLILDLADKSGVSSDSVSEFFNVLQQSSSMVTSSTIASSVISAIIPCLLAAAFLIIYFKSRNSDPLSSPSAGVTILYVFAIIELVLAILGTVLIVGFIALMFWVYLQYKNAPAGFFSLSTGIPELDAFYRGTGNMSGVLLAGIITFTVIGAIAIFFMLFVAINKKRYYRSIRSSINTVELHSEGARPYGVMCIIGAVSSGLSAMSSLSLLFIGGNLPGLRSLSGIAILSAISQLVNCVLLSLEAALALGYKNHIDSTKYGYSRHAAPAAPYAPFPAGAGYVNTQSQPMNNPYSRQQQNTANTYSDPYGTNPYVKNDSVPQSNPYAAANTDQAEEVAPEEGSVPTCPDCGAEVDPTAPFCGNCGRKL